MCPACGHVYPPMLTLTCYELSKTQKDTKEASESEKGSSSSELVQVWTQQCRHLSPYGLTTKTEEIMHAIGRRAVDERRLCAYGRTGDAGEWSLEDFPLVVGA